MTESLKKIEEKINKKIPPLPPEDLKGDLKKHIEDLRGEDIFIMEEKEGYNLIAYKKKLTTTYTNNNSTFNPYTFTETKDHCLMAIVQYSLNAPKDQIANFIRLGAKHVIVLKSSQIEEKLKEL